jgi:hypothetical protein
MKHRATYQSPRAQSGPVTMRVVAAVALVAAGPVLGWFILAATLGGHQ